MKIQFFSLIVIVLLLSGVLSKTNAQCDREVVSYGYSSVVAGKQSYGNIVAEAGDVNNDGYPDILVAATIAATPLNATATVYSGFNGDSLFTYYNNNNIIYSAFGFGDYNNDQYDDVFVNGVVYSGLDGDTLKKFDSSSRDGVSAGDVNLDGFYDLIDPGNGRVDLISGATNDTLLSWTGSLTAAFGSAVSPAGDFNNDGYIDIIIGEPGSDIIGTNRGRVFVYSGLDGSQLLIKYGLADQVFLGHEVSDVGDLNDDGYDDILVGSKAYVLNGSVATIYVYSGLNGATLFSASEGSAYDDFGFSIDGVGDISNDSINDFVVGSPKYSSGRGNVYLFSGDDGTLLYDYSVAGQPTEKLGYSVAGVGDTDGDGSPDFVAGAPNGHDPDNPDENNYFRGAAYLFRCGFPSYGCQIYDDFDWDLWSNVCDNCKWFQNMDQADDDSDGIGDMCEDSAFTGIGHVASLFGKMKWEYPGVYPQMIFDNVTVAGYTYLTMTPLNETTGFREIPWQGPLKYTLSSDAVFDGSVEVQFLYLDTNFNATQEEELQLFQKVDGYWRNITSHAAEPIFNRISGATTTLGDFAIGTCYTTEDIDNDGIGDLCDNCAYIANADQADLDGNFIGDACENSQSIPAGADGAVDITVGSETVNLSFNVVDQMGDVNMSVNNSGPATGANFTLFPIDPPKYYEITTDALFSGDITITLNYDDAGMTAEEEGLMSLWHYENNAWVNITDELNTVSNYVRGVTSSLSPFALGLANNPTDISENILDELPRGFTLHQNYPNPFNPETNVEYSTQGSSHILIEVFNIAGQKVRTLVDELKPAGEYKISWDGNDSEGNRVSSGIYLYRLQSGDYVDSKKMLLLK